MISRGNEGDSAYFIVFDHMIQGVKETFFFHGRNRRPPLDAVNALLSFAYSLRFYYLGNRYENQTEHFGIKQTYEPEGLLMV